MGKDYPAAQQKLIYAGNIRLCLVFAISLSMSPKFRRLINYDAIFFVFTFRRVYT